MENVLFLGSLLSGRVVQPRSAAAVDETIEVVGSNPAGGMGEKSAMTMAQILRSGVSVRVNGMGGGEHSF